MNCHKSVTINSWIRGARKNTFVPSTSSRARIPRYRGTGDSQESSLMRARRLLGKLPLAEGRNLFRHYENNSHGQYSPFRHYYMHTHERIHARMLDPTRKFGIDIQVICCPIESVWFSIKLIAHLTIDFQISDLGLKKS